MKIYGKIIFNKCNSDDIEAHEKFSAALQMCQIMMKIEGVSLDDLLDEPDCGISYKTWDDESEIGYEFTAEDSIVFAEKTGLNHLNEFAGSVEDYLN